jgi:hypothetical protein
MNFVGHAAVARWSRDEPAFLAGAMLPDFLHMTGTRVVEVRDPRVAAGVEHHHRVDDAFHGAPTFVALCADALGRLTSDGVRRGTARAVAHVGTELLLDGWLLHQGEVETAYVNALEWAFPSGLLETIRVRDEHAPRLHTLASRLVAWGAPHDYWNPRFVADRLETALSNRPRLAMATGEKERVASFLFERRNEVEACADTLLDEVRARLAPRQEATTDDR